jgi:hypothetical protein
MVIFGFAVSGTMAQTWTWQFAPVTPPGGITELTANPTTDVLYGLSAGSVITVTTGADGTIVDGFNDSSLTDLNDLTVGFQGRVYVIDDSTVGIWVPPAAPTALSQQPITPNQAGTFRHIASGKNGKLFVLYEVTADDQYILTGTPPIAEALVVKLNPQSLNLGSKGNWVTCLIEIPGYDINGIDLTSISITQFVIDGVAEPVLASIPVDTSAPYDFGTDKLMVKFVRYNKTTPDDPESFVGVLLPELSPGPSKGKINVTATIQATHDVLGTVTGESTFQVIVPKAKKQK